VGDGDNSLDADTQGNNEQLHDHSNNRHLKSIKYGNQFPNRNLSDWDFVSTPENWLFEVLFDYGEHDIESGAKEMRKWRLRRDPFSRYSAEPAFFSTGTKCRLQLLAGAVKTDLSPCELPREKTSLSRCHISICRSSVPDIAMSSFKVSRSF
jgi:hypothetical protein